MLAAILAHACRLANAGGGAIYTFDEVTEEFSLAATHGMSAELIEAIREAHPRLSDDSPVSQCTLTRSVIQIADLAAGPTYPLREAFLRARRSGASGRSFVARGADHRGFHGTAGPTRFL